MPLAPAERSVVVALNRSIETGSAKDVAGRTVDEKVSAGLLRADGLVLYRIEDEIPILLADEAIVVCR